MINMLHDKIKTLLPRDSRYSFIVIAKFKQPRASRAPEQLATKVLG